MIIIIEETKLSLPDNIICTYIVLILVIKLFILGIRKVGSFLVNSERIEILNKWGFLSYAKFSKDGFMAKSV